MRFVVFIFVLFISLSAFSQTKKIKDLENKRKQALREIANTNQLLSQTKKNTTTLLNRISLISSQITTRQEVVVILGQEIEQLTAQQAETEKEIGVLEVDLKQKQESYAKAVEGMISRRQKENRLLYILSGKSLGESFRRLMYLKNFSDWKKQQALDIKKQKDELDAKRSLLDKAKLEKLDLLLQREKEQKSMKDEEVLLKQEVAEANKRQGELQEMLKEKQKQADSLNAQIEKLIAEEVAKQEREAKRRASEEEKRRKEKEAREAQQKQKKEQAQQKSKNTKPKSQSKQKPSEPIAEAKAPTETKEDFVLSNNFASNRGKFPMPITGSSKIVSRFGAHRHTSQVTTNSNGIDIQSQAGAEARSIFGGEVSRVIAFPGYNNCIIVRHGNYYTFYGNIQNVYVKQGQKINAGQSLGQIYTDPEIGNSQMHFQLWKGTTKLNPESWLRR